MKIGLGIGIPFIRNYISSLFDPSKLFTGSTNGVWYDPSDLTTLYRDAAGTTPVTAVEQPVGLMLDKRDTAYSTYFDGVGDYLTAPASSALNLTTGSWTIEGWFYGTSFPNFSNNILVKDGISGSTYPQYTLRVTSGSKLIGEIGSGTSSNSFQTLTGTTTVTANAWHHFAFTFDGSLLRLFLDGAQEISAAKTVTMGDGGAPLTIGAQNNNPNNYFNGYISNVRIVKSTALYTANFTPPTAPLTPVAGTSLLTCGTTWSGNPTITNNGNTHADKLNPFTTGTGNHAFNSSGNSANFPVLSARYNLLTKTEDFSDAVWTKTNSTTTSTSLTESATSSVHVIAQSVTYVATDYTFTVEFKPNGRTWIAIQARGVVSYFNLAGSGALGNTIGAVVNRSIVLLDDGYYRCSLTVTATAGANDVTIYLSSANGTVSYMGDGVSGVLLRKADLRVANDALNQPAYQRVNTSTDYDTVGFKPYLRFNGTNQWLQTNSIDFTYGDKMFVCAGVRKLSDIAAGVLIETNGGGNPTYAMYTPSGNTANYGMRSLGTLGGAVATTSNVFPAPITNVVSLKGSIPDDVAIVRVNGSDAGSLSDNQGTGNYGNYPLYIGARGGSSLWFNGRLYSLVVAGKLANAVEITETEKYVNGKTAAY